MVGMFSLKKQCLGESIGNSSKVNVLRQFINTKGYAQHQLAAILRYFAVHFASIPLDIRPNILPVNAGNNASTNPAKLPWLLIGFLLFVLVYKVAMAIVISNQGFDLTDEGCYMLWYTYPDKDPNPFYYFHKIVLAFLPFIDWNIISLRILKIISDLAVVWLVSAVLYRNLPSNRKGLVTALFLLGVSGLGFYSIIYSRIFYEGDMSYLFAVMALGIPLLYLSPEKRKQLLVALLVSGIFIGLQFFNKFSASVVSLAVVGVLSIYLTRKLWGVLVLLGGIAAGVALFFVATGYSPAVWYQEYQDGYRYVIEPLGYNPLHLLIFYAIDGLVLLLLALLPLGAFALLRIVGQKINVWGVAHLIFTALVCVFYGLYYLLLPQPYSDAHYQYQSMLLNYWHVPAVSFGLYLFFMVDGIKGYTKQEWLVMLLLLLMPLVSMVGTGTSLAVSASAYLVPWFGILGLLLVKHFTRSLGPAIVLLGVMIIGAFTYFHFTQPFRLNATINQQQVPLTVSNEEILVDSTLAAFVISTKAVLQQKGIPNGYPIVALHNLPGLVYLVGGYSPATPWYFDAGWLNDPEYNQKLHNTNCLNIGRIKLFESRPPVFMINAYMLKEVTPCLLQHGFNVMGAYEPAEPVLNPFIRIENQVFGKNLSDSLLIFIPKRPYTQTSIN
jgi:hypothetical protein